MKSLTLVLSLILLSGATQAQFFSSAGDQEGSQGSGGNEQATYSIVVEPSWNLVSVPIVVADFATTSVFPNAITQASAYQGGAYIATDTLEHGVGYWLKFPSGDIVYLDGSSITSDSIDVDGGWNLIGSISAAIPTSSIIAVGSTVQSPFYTYSSAGYSPVSSIEPGLGHWVKMSGAGTLVLEEIPALLRPHTPPAEQLILTRLNSLILASASGATQQLFFGRMPDDGVDLNYFELPPPPPEGIPDVRFASGRFVEFYPRRIEGEARFAIRLSGLEYPLSVRRVSAEGTTERVRLTSISGEELGTAQPDGSVLITEPAVTTFLLKVTDATDLPTTFALHQNYPNPFNPVTTIRFDLPRDARITLDVYNILGQRVRSLVNEYREAGAHSVVLDASMLSSGVYFYRIDARGSNGIFTDVRKLVLLR